MKKLNFAKILGIGLLVIIAVFAFGMVTMLLWNALIPSLFNGPVLTYWQAIGLLILSKIFFGGGHGRGGSHHKHHQHGEWRSELKSRINKEDIPAVDEKQALEPSS